jgi:hypothetical protein
MLRARPSAASNRERLPRAAASTKYPRSAYFVPSPDVPGAKVRDQSRILIVLPTARTLVTLRAPQPDTRYADLGNYKLGRPVTSDGW